MTGPLLAVDWGTTNRRAYRIEDGRVVRAERDGAGAASIPAEGFAGELAALRGTLGDAPALLAGMIGSNVGWRVAPYVPAPCGLPEIAAALLPVDAGAAIVPGVSFEDGARADVMRGEEVLLLGAVAAGLAPADAFLCQPGTHSKWAVVEDARIVRFTTAMTGELFALLRAHGLLARQIEGDVADGAAFREGVAEGLRRDLAASLFGVRAAGLLGRRPDADAAAFASGVLIGAELAPRLEEDGRMVTVVAEPPLGALYAAAIEVAGREARQVDAQAAFVAGITRIRELSA